MELHKTPPTHPPTSPCPHHPVHTDKHYLTSPHQYHPTLSTMSSSALRGAMVGTLLPCLGLEVLHSMSHPTQCEPAHGQRLPRTHLGACLVDHTLPLPVAHYAPPSVCGSAHSFSISIPPSSSKYLSRMWKALRLSSNRSSSQSSMKYMFTARLQGQRTMTAHLLPSLLHHSPPPSHHSHHPPITPTTLPSLSTTLPSLSTTLPSLPSPSHHSHHPPITLDHLPILTHWPNRVED